MAEAPWTVLGAPSSVAAHQPGLERGPEAWRRAGLLEALRAVRPGTADAGDLPVERWRADVSDGTPNAWRAVVIGLERARAAAEGVLASGRRPLVLGGECTLAIPLVAAAVDRFGDVGLLYIDGGQDLMIPADHPEEPILDAMGVAHLLGLPGCVPELVRIGVRTPLLRPKDVVFVGYGDHEEDVHGLVPSLRLPAERLAADPDGVARAALGALRNRALIVHLDVDVLDALLHPAADIPSWGRGVSVEHVERLLGVVLADPRVQGMTLVEANPDHDPELVTFRAVAAMLAAAMVGPAGGACSG